METLPENLQKLLEVKYKEAGQKLLVLPFIMRQVGTLRLKSFRYYLHDKNLENHFLSAYIDWFIDQSEENWHKLIEAFGGEEAWETITQDMVSRTKTC